MFYGCFIEMFNKALIWQLGLCFSRYAFCCPRLKQTSGALVKIGTTCYGRTSHSVLFFAQEVSAVNKVLAGNWRLKRDASDVLFKTAQHTHSSHREIIYFSSDVQLPSQSKTTMHRRLVSRYARHSRPVTNKQNVVFLLPAPAHWRWRKEKKKNRSSKAKSGANKQHLVSSHYNKGNCSSKANATTLRKNKTKQNKKTFSSSIIESGFKTKHLLTLKSAKSRSTWTSAQAALVLYIFYFKHLADWDAWVLGLNGSP